jgi:hypothetical protein
MAAVGARMCEVMLVARRAQGQGLMEYGLIISLISVFAIASLFLFGTSFASLLGNTGGLASIINNP